MIKLSMSEEEMLKRKYIRPYEKRIEELEKENKNLESIAEHQQSSNMKRYFEIEELKKENAELKEQCSILADCNSCTSTCKTENIEMKKQLTKAKEIIKKLIEAIHIWDCKNLEEVEAEAEQFLSEVEK